VAPPLRELARAGTATATAPPTITPSPTPTLAPSEMLELGQQYLHHEDYTSAAAVFEGGLSQPGSLTREQQSQALWSLSLAYLRLERYPDAEEILQRYQALAAAGAGATPAAPGRLQSQAAVTETAQLLATGPGAAALFFTAEAQEGQGKCPEAIANYRAYLGANPDMAAYVQPLIARCELQAGDTTAAAAAYEAALQAGAHRLAEIENRQKLADYYLEAGQYENAVAQYEAIHDLAVTENTRGEMTYRSGQALMLAGQEQAAYDRYLFGANNYPRAYHSYLGLVELVEAGVDVSLYQRGLVDYYAGAYSPGIVAFEEYLAANPVDYAADAHLYLAWCYEAMGNTEAALAQFDRYAATGAGENAPRALAEKAAFYGRAGMADAALATHLELRDAYPATAEAAEATWQAALLQDARGARDEALALYWALVEEYPAHEQVPRALFRAGLREWQEGQTARAMDIWQRLAATYPAADYGAAAIIWLLRTAPEEERATYEITATAMSGVSYYPLRVQEVATGGEPFSPLPELHLEADEAAEMAAAEAWLAERLGLEEGASLSNLTPALRDDARLVRGQKLWQLGLYEQARRELEAIRDAYAGDALTTYQLALFFRDLGLYRSSILAAERLLALTETRVFEAPRLIGRLSYPVYYQELVLPLAGRYGYDPLLQFALIRQESLFESFVASFAGAQGLSQVMPGTGDDIARQLSWPDYDNEDLYRPYVGLEFGAFYLSQQLKAFDGSVYAALSAYNGGPGNAARWYASAGDDPDLYLETVDFRETRSYIQRIYTGYAVYQHLYGKP
ncbi:MAG: transglycosylase SLT domain-containing protein, partial [Anaerolineae bacterium]|nr:transglycosylase SLT domain-containing protein [Anaerolineae bacterium]